jgi:xylan 1,4-beta-xylosidase
MKVEKLLWLGLLACLGAQSGRAQAARGGAGASSSAQAPKTLRYINPLSVEDTRSIGDPMILRFKGNYYLFLSGGMAWSSDDLVHWKHEPAIMPAGRRVSAPHAFAYKDYLYLTGNDTGLFRSREPQGPWEYIGDFKDEKGNKTLLFDVMVYVDDDAKVYVYYSGRHTDGIYGAQLDPKDLTRFATPAKKFWSFNNSHVWERYGDNNESTEVSWIEAPWMTKRNGTYYLQYSAVGTEWKTYAVGVYTGKHPLGPFTYAPRNPILVHQNGLINGTGHHGVIEGPDGNLWAFYTLLYRNWSVFDRRIGMDPIGFDSKGNMFVKGPTEIPQWGPAGKAKPWLDNDTGSIPVSINRYTWAVSSSRPGRDALYAFDNNVRTWWEPAETDPQPWLMLDLGCRNDAKTNQDPNQEFIIDSSRILFDAVPHTGPSDLVVDGHSTWFRDEGRGPAAVAFKYKLEASLDNKTYRTVVDKTGNTAANNVEFDEFTPVQCRYVRLTVAGTAEKRQWGVLEFTVFGKSAGPSPVRTARP